MPQILPTAQRVLQVFEMYAQERRPLSNSEMARLLGLADSSCSDLLYTLRMSGYLLRAPKTRLFHPTARLLDVAQQIASADPLQIFATEALDMLSRQSGESSMCGHLEGNSVRIYACKESPRALRYVLKPGALAEIHTSAMGKALLGAMDEKACNELIEQLPLTEVTPKSITDKTAFKREIAEGRDRHYYITDGEGNESVSAIGIAGYVGGQLTAISLVGPARRMRENMKTNTDIMKQAWEDLFAT